MNTEKQKWIVLEDLDCVHVVPDLDSKPHGRPENGSKTAILLNMDCHCKPKIDFSGKKPIVVHNSFIDQEKINESMK